MDYLLGPNLIFIIAMFLGLILIIGQMTGSFGGDADHDVDHDIGHDVGHDAGHDTDGDHDHDQDGHDHGPSLMFRALSLLGVGRVPLTVVMMTAALVFGVSGLIANAIMEPVLRFPWVYGPISCGAALVVMWFCTGLIARLVANILPGTETYTVSKKDLVGKTANLILQAGPDSRVENAHVSDDGGTLHTVTCKTGGEVLERGTQVLLVSYDHEADVFTGEKARL